MTTRIPRAYGRTGCWRPLLAAGVAFGTFTASLVPAAAGLTAGGPPASRPGAPADTSPAPSGTVPAPAELAAASRTPSRGADAADGLSPARPAPAVSSDTQGTGRAVPAPQDFACVGADGSVQPGSFDYLTCVSRPEPTLVLLDPLIDLNLRLLEIAASVNDSRSLSLIGNLIAFAGTCIVGFTPLGTADTDSSSDVDGTASSSRGSGTLPVTFVELAYVSVPTGPVPTGPAERPAAGVAVAAAAAPDGDAHSSGAVTRERAQSDADATAPGVGVAVATHSEDLLGGQPRPPEVALSSGLPEGTDQYAAEPPAAQMGSDLRQLGASGPPVGHGRQG